MQVSAHEQLICEHWSNFVVTISAPLAWDSQLPVVWNMTACALPLQAMSGV